MILAVGLVSKFFDQLRQGVLFIMQRHQFHASNQWPIVGFVYEKTIMNPHGCWLAGDSCSQDYGVSWKANALQCQ